MDPESQDFYLCEVCPGHLRLWPLSAYAEHMDRHREFDGGLIRYDDKKLRTCNHPGCTRLYHVPERLHHVSSVCPKCRSPYNSQRNKQRMRMLSAGVEHKENVRAK